MMQPYGINVLGDIEGSLFIAGVFWAIMLFNFPLISGMGSLEVILVAITRAEALVILYHSFWVGITPPALSWCARHWAKVTV